MMSDSKVFDRIVDGLAAIAPTVAGTLLPGSGPLVATLMRAITGDTSSTIDEVAERISAASPSASPRRWPSAGCRYK